ncbi:MAG: TolC family protein [Myxococcales bacterium]|nr:TolC family protein [Myxococcales bacterium]
MIARFCAKGPARAIAQALLAEGRAGIDYAAVVPNPTASLEHSRSVTATEDSETVAGISFPLGIGGRRFLLSDAADERLNEKRAEGNSRLLDSALDLRELIARAVADAERSAVLGKQFGVLEELGKAIAGLKAGSESSAHDLLRHSLELEVLGERLKLQKARAASSKARLAALVDGDVAVSSLSLASLASDPPPSKKPVHPALARVDAFIRASEIETDAAHRRWVPDLEIFFGYRQVTALEADTGHGFALRVAMPITFFDHGQGEASIFEARSSAGRAEREAIIAITRAEERAADDAIATLDETPTENDDTPKRTEKLLEQAKDLYLAGEGSMVELAAASALAESAALARIDAEEARALARIAKMRAVGSLFDPALDRVCRVTQ